MESPKQDKKPNLYGLDRDALSKIIVETYGAPKFHGPQIYRWLYQRREFDPADWSDLSKSLRERLAEDFRIDPGHFEDRVVAKDGTIKFRVELPEGGVVETVYMRYEDRVTLCISSQVGCALNCDFCLTAKMGFIRHLSPGEIVGQVALVQEDRQLEAPFNIVFMGMGEPMHNYKSVIAAFRILQDAEGVGLSRKRITVSTAGLVPAIDKLAKEPLRPRLAVSLNATTNEVRDRIMPINRKYPIEKLVKSCRNYGERTGDSWTFEYVLLRDINDRPEDVKRLAELTHGHQVKVNLIPFNAVEGWLEYQPPERAKILAFRDALLRRDVQVSVRWSRGVEARAACGQLALLPDTKDASDTVPTGQDATADEPRGLET